MEGRFTNRWLPYLLVLPSVAIVVVFLLGPSVQVLYLSLFEVASFGGRSNFVGLGNFRELLASDEYLHSLQVSLLFAAGAVVSGMAVSLGIAVLANRRIPGIALYRTALLWPYALSPAVAGTVWGMLFDPSTGFMTFLIRLTTGLTTNWNMNGTYALALVIAAAVWKMLGFNIIFFLAGLQGVPGELLEAAQVDGATARQSFWRITFPLLSPTTFFLLVMNSLYGFFEVFGLIDVMTLGGPGRATDLLVYKLYRDGFVSIRWGFASAQSIVLFVMVGLLTLVQFRYAGRRVFYS